MTTITIEEYIADRNAFYLTDVRTPSEYSEAHIQTAQLHPLDSINPNEVRFKAQDKKILLSCLSGARCKQAAKQFQKANVEVAELEGSLQGWEAAGEPVVRSTPTGLPLVRQVHLVVSLINIATALLALLVNPAWAWVLVGTGVGLFLSGATGFCGLGLILAKMPWNKQPIPNSDSCEAG